MKSIKASLPYLVLLIVGISFLLLTCNKIELKPVIKVSTDTVSDISFSTCTVTGTLSSLGEGVNQHGFCWSTSSNPSINDNNVQLGAKSATGIFSAEISNLTQNTTYYIKAYATGNNGTIYGETKLFETPRHYPTNGLISYFNFDNNLKDKLGNTPDGTNYGGATFTAGKAGKAITLNGTNQYIQFGRKTYKSGNNISVALWLKKPNTAESLKFFVMCSDFAVATQFGYGEFVISVPSTNNAKGPITANTWVHLAGTYDGTNIKVYINGVLRETKNWPGTISVNNRYLILGYFSASYWGGSIDDLFIYNKVLTKEEINQLYDYH